MTDENYYSLRSKGHRPHPALRVFVPIVLVSAAVFFAVWLVKTSPKPKPRPPRERAATVTVTNLSRVSTRVMIETTGTVVPSRSVTLVARVSGQVVWVDPRFIPGGHFLDGQTLLKIDPVDYELAATNRWAGVVKAEYDLEVERGMQELAAYEWKAVATNGAADAYTPEDRRLALREPHLRLAQGNLISARAMLKDALLDLERTAVKAPFNAVVRTRQADLGAEVTTQTPLAELAATDAYWVRVAIPARQLHWVHAADEGAPGGAPVTITTVPGMDMNATWRGTVLRKLPDLEPGGRQAQLIIEVPKPETPATGTDALLLDAYVRVRIEGPTLQDVIAIPRTALHEGTNVWIVRGDNRLEIRPVTVVWSDRDRAVIGEGVSDGETMVLSDLSVPIGGMLLKMLPAPSLHTDGPAAPPSATGEPGGGRP